ncbi:hypothetical protein FRB93_006036 [Tulasnella sp. JGI-2019a]|nr:hypothetical protein FRB93_006036 [Tulasnella sp. JGI-2019a]
MTYIIQEQARRTSTANSELMLLSSVECKSPKSAGVVSEGHDLHSVKSKDANLEAVQPVTNLAPGDKLYGSLDGQTLIINPRPFASGGIADMYLGTWMPTPLRIVVAVKVFRSRGVLSSGVNKAFARELHARQGLKHRRIAHVYGYMNGKDTSVGDGPLLVMPYYRHGDLHTYVHRNPSVDRLALLVQAAEGLQYIHSLQPPIAHLDVTPFNILITDQGEASLNGFIAAKRVGDIDTSFTSSSPAFTTGFASPEIIMGEKGTTASDVYSFSCVMLMVLSGNRPFYSYNGLRVMMAVVNGDKPLRMNHTILLFPPAQDALWQLFDECWALEPQSRPLITDVIDQLRSIHMHLKETPSVSITWDTIPSDSVAQFSISVVHSTPATSLGMDALDDDVCSTNGASFVWRLFNAIHQLLETPGVPTELDITGLIGIVAPEVMAQGGFYAIYRGHFADTTHDKTEIALRYPLAKYASKVLSKVQPSGYLVLLYLAESL